MSSEEENNLQLYQSIIDNSPDIIIRFNTDLQITYCNKALEKALGMPSDSFLGRTFLEGRDLIPSQMSREQFTSRHRILQDCLEKKEEIYYEEHVHFPTGDKYLITRIIPELDQSGREVISLLAVSRDLTSYKKTEATLQESEERYRSIIKVSNTGVWEFHGKAGYLWCSPEYFEMLGRNVEDYPMDGSPNLKENWIDLMHPEDRERASKTFADYLAAGSPGMYENTFRLSHRDGHWVWIWSRGQTIRKPDGELTDITVGTHIDYSEAKKTEDELRYLSHHDNLTGIYNRYYFEQLIKNPEVKKALPIRIIMADLNGLKLINDTYGCDYGDKVLKTAASIIKQSCRAEDTVARWGGDEFVILMPRASNKDANKVCKTISSMCAEKLLEDVPISISAAIAGKVKEGGNLFDTLREAENSLARQKLTESRSAKSSVLQTLFNTLAAKSFETETHTKRMQSVAMRIGRRLNLTDSELSHLELLITLHDIGKINIAEEILTKRGPLTEKEWGEIKKHPEIGFRIARATDDFSHVAEDILSHHERWDGQGYPQGLKEDETSLPARITAIADAYEVMSNGRPYKKVMTRDEIKAEFERCAGKQFDPDLADLFIKILDEEL